MATSKRRAALEAWLIQAEQILKHPDGDVPDDSGEDVRFETGDSGMTGGLVRQPPTGTKRLYWRVDPAMSDEELEAWAGHFVDAVLGDVIDGDAWSTTARESLPTEMHEHPPEIA